MSKRDGYLRRKYGITEEQYDLLLAKQGGGCGVCHKPPVRGKPHFAVDHNHRTLEIRGILCYFCNHKIVGRHQTPTLLNAAGKYLEGPYTGWFTPEKRRKRRRRGRSNPVRKQSRKKYT